MTYQNPERENSIRAEVYHRLDVSLAYSLQKKKVQHRFKLGVYNFYDRRNPAFYRLDYDDDEDEITTQAVRLLPALPSLSYQLQF